MSSNSTQAVLDDLDSDVSNSDLSPDQHHPNQADPTYRLNQENMSGDTVSILDGSTFLVCDRRGDIEAGADQPHGLFFRDTRFLSLWRLTLDGAALTVLSTDDVDYFSSQFFLVPVTGSIYRNPCLSVIRQRSIGDGLHEDLVVLNHLPDAISVELRVDADADFADIFEVKDALVKSGERSTHVRKDALVLRYQRGEFFRETRIVPSVEAQIDASGLSFSVRLAPHGQWQTCIDVVPNADHQVREKHRHGSMHSPVPNMRESLDDWIAQAPVLRSSWDPLCHIYDRSLVDLAALRFYTDVMPDVSLPAAGLPWFMALFGRDSLLTSYQTLPFTPELAVTTLRVLARCQGESVDGFRDEEPGKIMHELRVGELTTFGERPQGPSFGSADATPLFLILLEETERWTGDVALVKELEAGARAAIDWIDNYGDRDGDGYVEYQTSNPETGLENMCWKDSPNSIMFADGSPSKLPRATCEIQGYVYDAKCRTARLARDVWADPTWAAKLLDEAAELKRRFNEDFWISEPGFFALALDGDKRRVDSLTSNIGQLLWSGIVDDDRAQSVVDHLMSERLFSGWGIRTMAEGESCYNPIEYHNGTVWPHDNSFIVAGLRRYGYADEAARLSFAVLEAATHFNWRLPEAFAGYPRQLTGVPVEYPTASSPQAWSTGAPLLLLRTILGLEPGDDGPTTDPVLPIGIESLHLEGVLARSNARSGDASH